ncbi:probable E3 ubiquitin-protein ligase HIP1 isoform X2 [Lathyrus oleraceus]|uniref:RING-type E3 ubiquitin transferase n=1 Tax=Pisum sativum TaxID=3888 RepID=A0A9D5AMY1_PEA|nr:probable E3 ubiquitin-protein ligase HIP1 isoform X2 [Pisum sativum]KAI5418072.1 hypothetical protein KIW84_042639 [Pisum sativum]
MSQQGENEEIYNSMANIDESDAISTSSERETTLRFSSVSSSMSATRMEEILNINNVETYVTREIQSHRRLVRSEMVHRNPVGTMIPVGSDNGEQQSLVVPTHDPQMIRTLVQNNNRIAFHTAIERLHSDELLRPQDIRVLHSQLMLHFNEWMKKMRGGLTGEEIRKAISGKIFEETSQIKELCCICQEEYMNGEECGKLDCEHYFHMKCIKKWLTEKNMCPLCKCMGLAFVDELIDG